MQAVKVGSAFLSLSYAIECPSRKINDGSTRDANHWLNVKSLSSICGWHRWPEVHLPKRGRSARIIGVKSVYVIHSRGDIHNIVSALTWNAYIRNVEWLCVNLTIYGTGKE